MKIYRLRRIGRYVGVPEVPDILNELYFRSRQDAEDMRVSDKNTISANLMLTSDGCRWMRLMF